MTDEIKTYKAFNSDWTCRGYQFEVGKSYEVEGKIKACENGFHACENPLDLFVYYPPTGKFALVSQSGDISRAEDDSKIASAKITISTEVFLPQIVSDSISWLKSKLDWSNPKTISTGDLSAAASTGYRSAAASTGDLSAAASTGHRSAAASTGDLSAAASTGDLSAAASTGHLSAASVDGKGSVAIAIGEQSKVKASTNGAIVAVYRDDDGELVHIKAAKVGEYGILPDVWYSLNEHGNFVGVE